VSRAFWALNDNGQKVIFAHYVIRGMPIKEKAGCLGWTVPTYYRRLTRANGNLSSKLNTSAEFDKAEYNAYPRA